MWSVLGPTLTPAEALKLAERVLASDSGGDALSELSEAALLRADDEQWRRAKTAYIMAHATSGGIRTGSVFDQLEEATGGNVTAEALDAFFEKLTGAA